MIRRNLTPEILSAVADRPVVLLHGARQTGKTTLVQSLARQKHPARYLTLDDAAVFAAFLPKLSESLAGRMEILTLWPFSQGEMEDGVEGFIDALFAGKLPQPPGRRKTEDDLHARIGRGGFPEPAAMDSDDRRRIWFGSYVTAILQRDIRELAHIDGLEVMPRLLAILASRPMGLLNFADLSRISGLTQSTVKRYVALLEATFLV